MNKTIFAATAFLMSITVISCSKKNHPTTTTGSRSDSTTTVKTPSIKTAIPKVITVDDKVARRSVDGRYYYDLEGHRYWRNNRDGKYYLFNRSMFNNPDFKSPGKQ